MDRSQYLQGLHEHIIDLVDDPLLENLFSQVRSRAMQYELLPEPPEVAFTFDRQKLWNSYDQIFVDGSLLYREGAIDSSQLNRWVRKSAQAYEYLSKFLPDEQREILLVNSALCYQIAGYRANAQCLSRQVKAEYLVEDKETQYDQQLAKLFLTAVVDYLKNDIKNLQITSDRAISITQDSQSLALEGLEADDLAATKVFSLVRFPFFRKQ